MPGNPPDLCLVGLLALTPQIAELVHSHLAEDFCGSKMDLSISSHKMAINVLGAFKSMKNPSLHYRDNLIMSSP